MPLPFSFSVLDLRKLLGLWAARESFQGIAEFPPGVQSTLQRADALDAFISEQQRHPGAGRFVWSSTVQNDFTIVRKLFVLLLEFAGVHAESAGNGFGVGFEINGVPEVHNR